MSLLVGASLCTGLVPNLMASPSHWFNHAAHAQDSPSSSEIAKYARAVLQMEPHRRQAMQRIQNEGGSTSIVCSDVFNGLPGGQVAANYCDRAANIVKANGLSNRRFNQITEIAQQNATVQSQIQAQMAQLCRQSEFQDACR